MGFTVAMEQNLSKQYNPQEAEDTLYAFWEENGYFKADNVSQKPSYTIVMPPPNITGHLHMGHALDCTLQDVLIRYKRMAGFNALWVPGTDHASISTEMKVVEKIMETGETKATLGREAFLKEAWKWKDEYGGHILRQLRKLGSSCDWSRTRFTLDEGLSAAVQNVFLNLYAKGLIYRSEKLVNWCRT
jgi:valyl-tRNA synthetase